MSVELRCTNVYNSTELGGGTVDICIRYLVVGGILERENIMVAQK